MSSKFSSLYSEHQVLGKGSFGEVRRCIKKSTGEPFAVKIIKTNLNKESLEDIMHEARICRKLQHPNIVRLLDNFNEKDFIYLVFDLVVGGELMMEIQDRKYYSEADASYCMKKILEGIKYCHEKDIVHTDLKPENILLTSKRKDAIIKIADFGLASEVFGDKYDWYGGGGTAYYMSPEVINEYDYGKPIDMWAIGVILYVLLIGDYPFDDDENYDVKSKIITGVFTYPSDREDTISMNAKDLVKRMLTVDSYQRITARDALKHSWIDKRERVAAKMNLDKTIVHLKKFNARRKFKAAILAAVAANKLFKIGAKNILKKHNARDRKQGKKAKVKRVKRQ